MSERAFRYGDGVFVTLGLRQGQLGEPGRHLSRLTRACAVVGLQVPGELQTTDRLAGIVSSLIAGSAAGTEAGDGTAEGLSPDVVDGAVRIQVSAGVSDRGYGRVTHAACWALVEVSPLPADRRLRMEIAPPDSDLPPPAVPTVKSCSALPQVLVARLAASLGCDEVIRLHAGRVTEAAAANLFWWSGETVFTPREDLPLYAGVTRQIVLEVAAEIGLSVQTGAFGPESLLAAEAVFLTNAVRGLEQVFSLHGRQLEWPAPLQRLQQEVSSARLREAIPVSSALRQGPNGDTV